MNNYYKPTPKKWRKIGDAILAFGLLMNGFIMSSPMTDSAKAWGVSISSLISGLGKIATNFFKEDEAE